MMPEHLWVWGAAAAVGVAASLWSKARAWGGRALGLLVGRRNYTSVVADRVYAALRRDGRQVWVANQWYAGGVYIRRTPGSMMGHPFVYRFSAPGATLFLVGRVPVWAEVDAVTASTNRPRQLKITYPRGLFDADAFTVSAVVKAWKETVAAMPASTPVFRSNFSVTRVSARDPSGVRGRDGERPTAVPNNEPNVDSLVDGGSYDAKYADWVGPPKLPDAEAEGGPAPTCYDNLALSPAAVEAAEGCRRWLESGEWYRERDVPWRHGVLLKGPPGNGKTSFILATCKELGLPLKQFDLASMGNRAFLDLWREHVEGVSPVCVALEDFDAVFERRANVTGKQDGLTFDCLLNALDGVTGQLGLLLFVTTNRPELLDAAVCGDGSGPTRPGRINTVLEMPPPDAAGRAKIARRVLKDCLHEVEGVVTLGHGDSADQFTNRCRVVALDYKYGRRAAPTPKPTPAPPFGSPEHVEKVGRVIELFSRSKH